MYQIMKKAFRNLFRWGSDICLCPFMYSLSFVSFFNGLSSPYAERCDLCVPPLLVLLPILHTTNIHYIFELTFAKQYILFMDFKFMYFEKVIYLIWQNRPHFLKLKVSKSQKQFMVSLILPIYEWKTLYWPSSLLNSVFNPFFERIVDTMNYFRDLLIFKKRFRLH